MFFLFNRTKELFSIYFFIAIALILFLNSGKPAYAAPCSYTNTPPAGCTLLRSAPINELDYLIVDEVCDGPPNMFNNTCSNFESPTTYPGVRTGNYCIEKYLYGGVDYSSCWCAKVPNYSAGIINWYFYGCIAPTSTPTRTPTPTPTPCKTVMLPSTLNLCPLDAAEVTAWAIDTGGIAVKQVTFTPSSIKNASANTIATNDTRDDDTSPYKATITATSATGTGTVFATATLVNNVTCISDSTTINVNTSYCPTPTPTRTPTPTPTKTPTPTPTRTPTPTPTSPPCPLGGCITPTPTRTPTPTITGTPRVTVLGRNVDASANALTTDIGQSISITGPVTGTSYNLGAWDFSSIPIGTYTVTAAIPGGYSVYYSYSGKNISPPTAGYIMGNVVSTGSLSNNGDWADIYFMYVPFGTPIPPTRTPTPTPTKTITPTPGNYSISGKLFIDSNHTQISTGNPDYDSDSFTVTLTGPSAGTITKSPPPLGDYLISGLAAGDYTVKFSEPLLSGDYAFTYPFPNPVDCYLEVTVGPGCAPSGKESECDSDDNIIKLNAGVINTLTDASAWFQSVGTDMRWDSGFGGKLTLPNNQYASLPGTGGMPGIMFSGSLRFPFPGQASESYNWQVGNPSYPEIFTDNHSVITTSYAFLLATAKKQNQGNDPTTITGLNNSLNPGVYKTNEDQSLEISSDISFIKQGNFVILVDRDLYINAKITVPVGSTLIFSVKGDIMVNANIGEEGAATECNAITHAGCSIEGVYSADGNFYTKWPDTANDCSGGVDKRLNIAGSVIANAGRQGGTFKNTRTLCTNNSSYPSVSFIERPDFMLFYPSTVKFNTRVWQELAP